MFKMALLAMLALPCHSSFAASVSVQVNGQTSVALVPGDTFEVSYSSAGVKSCEYMWTFVGETANRMPVEPNTYRSDKAGFDGRAMLYGLSCITETGETVSAHASTDAMGSAPASQTEFLSKLAKLNGGAAKSLATRGVVDLSEGISLLDTKPMSARVLIDKGRSEIEAAQQLKSNEVKAEAKADGLGNQDEKDRSAALEADEKALKEERADKIFRALEAKYKVRRKELVRRALGSDGNMARLEELLGMSPGKLGEAHAAAEQDSTESKKNSLEFEVNPEVALRSGLKEKRSLRRDLASALENRNEDLDNTPWSEEKIKGGPSFNGLSAKESEFFPSAEPDQIELTLFDVIHRCYQKRWKTLY